LYDLKHEVAQGREAVRTLTDEEIAAGSSQHPGGFLPGQFTVRIITSFISQITCIRFPDE
jgi:hypothetical protein